MHREYSGKNCSQKVLKYGAVFHHYNKGARKVNGSRFTYPWTSTVQLDMSSVDSGRKPHPAIRGGEEVGYQKEKRKTTKCPLSYRQERSLSPCPFRQHVEHHDTHNIVAVMQNMMEDMAKANIRTDGLFLNADADLIVQPSAPCSKLWNCVKHLYQCKRNER